MERPAPIVLEGPMVRLEPLGREHLPGLQAIIEGPRETFGLTPVPRNRAELDAYLGRVLEDQSRGQAVPFATIDPRRGRVVGTTRFATFEFWTVPPDSPLARPSGAPHAVEIGWTWLAPDAQRTAINTGAKRLMLAHAFERWEVLRVTLKTDARNVRSRTAIARVGGTLDGIVRSHSPGADGGVRDVALFSILAREWPEIRARLDARIARGAAAPT